MIKLQHPHSEKSELAVLGAMLGNTSSLNSVLDILEPQHFHNINHQIIFQALKKLHDDNTDVDVITLSDILEGEKHLDRVGGNEYLLEMLSIVPSASSAEYYANIVLEKSRMRGLETLSLSILDSLKENKDVQETCELVQKMILEIELGSNKKEILSFSKLLAKASQELEKVYESDKDFIGIPTGFKTIDALLNGFEPGKLYVIAARPSMGKSALAGNMTLRIAQTQNPKYDVPIGYGVGFFSLEMTATELVNRFCSEIQSINNVFFKRKDLSPSSKTFGKIIEGYEKIQSLNIQIDDVGQNSLSNIQRGARRMVRGDKRHGVSPVDIIFIDHLQLIRPPKHLLSANPNTQVGFISTSLKALAKELDIPIVLLCQLNRKSEWREDKRPRLSDLRDSGVIEQDADVVALLFREEHYKAELIIEKNRSGALGIARLKFQANTTTFTDISY